MKKRMFLFLLAAGALALTGCASGGKTTEEAENTVSNTDEVITGYLIEDAGKHLTLGNFKDMEVYQPVVTVTDDMVESEMLARLSEYSTPEEVTDGAQYMDTINMDMTATPKEDEPLEQTDYSFDLGNEDFGPQFDEKMYNVKPGDHLTFTLDYTDSGYVQNWEGQEVDFDVTINSVTRISIPELTEEVAKDTLGYESVNDYREDVRKSLEKTYASQSQQTLLTQALDTAESLTEFKSVPKTLYESVESSMNNQDQLMADSMNMTLDEYRSSMGLDDDDQSRILQEVHRKLFISAYCQKNGLELTQADYRSYLENNYDYYGYTDAESFEEAFGQDNITWNAYTDLVGDALLRTAKIVDTSFDYTADDMSIPEDPETDADVVVNGLDDPYEEVMTE